MFLVVLLVVVLVVYLFYIIITDYYDICNIIIYKTFSHFNVLYSHKKKKPQAQIDPHILAFI